MRELRVDLVGDDLEAALAGDAEHGLQELGTREGPGWVVGVGQEKDARIEAALPREGDALAQEAGVRYAPGFGRNVKPQHLLAREARLWLVTDPRRPRQREVPV
jgi:hypothetical protein